METHDEKLAETVARAVLPVYCPQLCSVMEGPWTAATGQQRRYAMDAARAALDAINLDERIRAAVEQQRMKDAEIAREQCKRLGEPAIGGTIADAIEAQS